MPRPSILANFPPVKFLFLLIALVCPLKAELLAHFHTTRGDVTVVLHHDKTPQTVANFIALAQGTRPWLDPRTGSIRMTPYYDGTKFHRMNNNAIYQFAQGGSRIGDGSDGPGYTFKDEFHPSLTHVPYVLSMGNRGPNSNGSGFFLTGSIATPNYDGSYTVFGNVIEPASRTVVDEIIAAGPDGTTVNHITFSRTDPAAVAFNEQAQNLPTVAQAKGNLSVTAGVAATWTLAETQNAGDVFRAFRSTTLEATSWQELIGAYRHNGFARLGLASSIPPVNLDDATASKAFYNLTYVRHPGSVTPSTLSNRVIAMGFGSETLVYAFDSEGDRGTATLISGPQTSSSFPFIIFEKASEGHAFSFFVKNSTTQIPELLLCRIGCDAASNLLIAGRHFTYVGTSQPDLSITLDPLGGGYCEMTR